MQIEKKQNGEKLELVLSGRLDTITAPVLDGEINSSLAGVTELTLNFSGIDYISSAGLRVILAAQKLMNSNKGAMVVIGVSENIMEIFQMTGFADILTIK